jgi:hypothetical protein
MNNNSVTRWAVKRISPQILAVLTLLLGLPSSTLHAGRTDFIMGANSFPITNTYHAGDHIPLSQQMKDLTNAEMRYMRLGVPLSKNGKVAWNGVTGATADARFEEILQAAKDNGVKLLLVLQSLSMTDTNAIWTLVPYTQVSQSQQENDNYYRAFNATYTFMNTYKDNANFRATVEVIECDNEMAQYTLDPGVSGKVASDYYAPNMTVLCAYLRGMSIGLNYNYNNNTNDANRRKIQIMINSYEEKLGFFDFLDLSGNVVPWDLLGWHSYHANRTTSTRFSEQMNILAAHGKDIWITEFNGMDDLNVKNANGTNDDEANRDYYDRMFQDSRIKAAFIFTLYDEPTAGGFGQCGMYSTDRSDPNNYITQAKSTRDLMVAETLRRTDANYKLKSSYDSQLMTVNGSSFSDGASVIKWPAFGAISQLWYFADTGSGWSEIINRNSHKTLCVNGSFTNNGDALIQWADFGGAGQYWKFSGDGNKNYRIINKNSGLVATVGGSDGYSLNQWTTDSSLNTVQQWNFVSENSSTCINKDIGTSTVKGSFFYNFGIHTNKGAGAASITATTDAFNYTYDKLTGDGSITAKVTSMTNPNPNAWARAGVMIRDGTAANAKSVAVLMTPSNGVNLQWRATAGAAASNTKVAGKVAPYWVKLVRAGNVFTGYYSADNVTWTAYATKTVVMNTAVFMGLAVSSNVSGTLCTATFEKVNMTGNITILP